MANKHSIADLRIYQLALEQEDKVYKLAKTLSADQFELANDLRRAGAAVPHYIYEAHQRYSYQSKIEALHAARTQAERAVKLLESPAAPDSGRRLVEDYTALIKQTWGLIKYLKQKLAERNVRSETQANELVTSRP